MKYLPLLLALLLFTACSGESKDEVLKTSILGKWQCTVAEANGENLLPEGRKAAVVEFQAGQFLPYPGAESKTWQIEDGKLVFEGDPQPKTLTIVGDKMKWDETTGEGIPMHHEFTKEKE